MLKVKEIPIEKVRAAEHDGRLEFDEEILAGLVESIKEFGLLYPIIVKEVGEDFIILDGHTRFRACKMLNKRTITCSVTSASKEGSYKMAFAGNFFRKDLTPVELSCAMKDCLDSGGMTVAELAVGFHRSEHWVTSMIAIGGWPQDVQQAVHLSGMSIAAASNLALVTDEVYRKFLVANAVEQGATARTTSAWLQAFRNMAPQEEAVKAEPVAGIVAQTPLTPQSPCFCCSQVFAMNELSHIPICGACVQIMRQATMPQS